MDLLNKNKLEKKNKKVKRGYKQKLKEQQSKIALEKYIKNWKEGKIKQNLL